MLATLFPKKKPILTKTQILDINPDAADLLFSVRNMSDVSKICIEVLARKDKELGTSLSKKKNSKFLTSLKGIGMTPLMISIWTKNLTAFSLLLEAHRANNITVNTQDTELENTALHYACQSNNPKMITELFSIPKINANIRNKDGNTPLHFFCSAFCFPDIGPIIEMFAKAGVDFNEANNNGETPLHKSCFNNKIRSLLIDALLEHGASVNRLNKNGEGPLHFAIWLNRKDIVSKLLSAGADYQLKGIGHKTPLELGKELGRKEIVKMLLQVEHLAKWLSDINPEFKELYLIKLMKEDIYLDVLPDVSDFVLKEIGIENQEHRKTILDKAKEIKEEDIEEAEDEQKEKESEQKKESSEQKTGKATQTTKLNDKKQQPEQGKEASYAIRPEEIEYLDDVAQKRRKIGAGSNGKVYAALYKGKEVAVKAVHGKEGVSKGEKDIMKKLHHPNVVEFYGEFISPHSEFCIVLEYCQRGPLDVSLASPHSDYSLKRSMQTLKDILKGIDYIHSLKPYPIYHRDIKSANVLIDHEWVCKLCDFGEAVECTPENAAALTVVSGTLEYLDPVLSSDDLHALPTPYTAKSDIYSFGILFWEVLYRCFNGSYGRPWWSQYDLTTPCDALIRAQEGERPILPDECPKSLSDIYNLLVDGNPELRPDAKSALELLDNAMKTIDETKTTEKETENDNENENVKDEKREEGDDDGEEKSEESDEEEKEDEKEAEAQSESQSEEDDSTDDEMAEKEEQDSSEQ